MSLRTCSAVVAFLLSTVMLSAAAPAADRAAQPPAHSVQKPGLPGRPPGAAVFCADPAVTLHLGAPTFSGGVFRVGVEAKICNAGTVVFNAPADDELKLVINGIAELRKGDAWQFLDEPGRLLQWVELQPYLAQLAVNDCRTLRWSYGWTAAAGPSTAGLTALASGVADAKLRVGLFAFASNRKNQTEPLNPTYPASLNCKKKNDYTERLYLYLK